MVLGQAREIVAAYGGATALAVAATTGLTGAIALARISGGWLLDRFAVPTVICAAHALALGGGLLLNSIQTCPKGRSNLSQRPCGRWA